MKKFVLMLALTIYFFSRTTAIFSQTLIYRSVQQSNTLAIADLSANAITISGSTLTATSALPDTIGVGDAVQYDSSNAGAVNAIAFIQGRTSSTVFTVKRFNGGTPASCTGDTDGDIFRAYTAISDWESRTENTGIAAGVRNFDSGAAWNLVTADQQWHVALYGQTQGGVIIDSWTTGTGTSVNYIRTYTPKLSSEVGVSQRHNGFYTLTKVRVTFNAIAVGFTVSVGKLLVEGIQFDGAGASAQQGIYCNNAIASAVIDVTDCIFKGFGSGSSSNGIRVEGASTLTTYVSNCIVYDWNVSAGLFSNSATMTMYAYNNTIVDCALGISRGAGTVVAKNNLCYSNSTADFAGTFAAGSEYNASSDASAPGTNSRINQTFTFVDEAGNNFLLSPNDLGARNFGKSLLDDTNLVVLKDITGLARPQGPNFDMGASEAQATNVTETVRRKYIQ